MKICTNCKKDLDLSMFSFRKDNKTYRNQCRICAKARIGITKKFPKIYKVEPTQFTQNFSPITCYLLGLIWADGHINHKIDKRRGTRNKQIVLKTQLKDHNHFKNIFLKTGDWAVREYPKNNNGKISTSNIIIVDFLLENDYAAKSWKSADKILSKIPKDLHCYWFLGLVDGDGGFNITKHSSNFSIWSGVEQDWTYLTNKYNELKLKYSKYIKRSYAPNQHGSSQIRISNLIDIIRFCNYIYRKDALSFCLPRKLEKYQELKGRAESFFGNRQNTYILPYNGNKKRTFFYQIKKSGKEAYAGKFDTLQKARDGRDKDFIKLFGKKKFYEFFGSLDMVLSLV